MYVNILKNLAASKLPGSKNITYPVIASLYLTHRCNLNCTYCSDGNGNPFYFSKQNELTSEEIFKILKIIVKSTKHLNITGGEPLLRDDIVRILEYARSAGFKYVSLNSNGLLLDRYPALLDYVDELYLSLDSFNIEKLKALCRTDRSNIEKILNNISNVSSSGNKNKLIISSVITMQNIQDIYEIVDYCKLYRIGFSASPALNGIAADAALRGSDEYRSCIDYIIRAKKTGTKIIGSIEYYNTIRDFTEFQCYPLLLPAINPEGFLYLPCLEIGKKMVQLTDYNSLGDAIQSEINGLSYPPECGNVCHILCHAGLSLLFKNISVPLSELFYNTKYSIINRSLN